MTLDGQTDMQSRFSLTQVFGRELDTLRSDFAEAWTGEAECNLLIAKLYLYSMFISPKSELNTTGIGGPHDTIGPSKRTIRSLGFATVVRLVAVFKTQCGYPQREQNSIFTDKSSNLPYGLEFYPKFYFRTMVFAACFLLYLLLTEELPTPEDEKTARDNVEAIHDIFREYELKFVNDIDSNVHKLAADAIGTLRRAMSRESNFARFTVESRMGASIFFGAMRTMKEAQRREALKERQNLLLQQTMQESSMGNHHAESSSTVLPMDLESDFLWEQQLSAEWNFQWGIWGRSMADFSFGGELGGDLSADMGAFQQP